MAGLYDRLEEVAFKQVPGGYVFQTRNPWLFGPQRGYFVNDAQKAEIATCLRQTMRRITPFVLVAAILIPLVLVAAMSWLVIGGGPMVSLTIVGLTGESTIFTQPISPAGAKFVFPGPDTAAPPAPGAISVTMTAIEVSGLPGSDAVARFTEVDQTGKSTTYSQPFGPDGAKVSFTGPDGSIVFTLAGRAGTTSRAAFLYVALLALGINVPYIALVHVYRMRKLQPLIAGLPRSDQRITMREQVEGLAAKMSFKFLLVTIVAVVGGAVALSANAIGLATAILEHRPIPQMNLLAMATSSLATAYFAYVLVLRLKPKRTSS